MSDVRGIGNAEHRWAGGLDTELLDKMQAFIDQAMKAHRELTSAAVDIVPSSQLNPAAAPAGPDDKRADPRLLRPLHSSGA